MLPQNFCSEVYCRTLCVQKNASLKIYLFFVFIVFFVFSSKISIFQEICSKNGLKISKDLSHCNKVVQVLFCRPYCVRKTMFIHDFSFCNYNHFLQVFEKKVSTWHSPSILFSIFKNQTNNTKFLFCTQRTFNLLYKVETN